MNRINHHINISLANALSANTKEVSHMLHIVRYMSHVCHMSVTCLYVVGSVVATGSSVSLQSPGYADSSVFKPRP